MDKWLKRIPTHKQLIKNYTRNINTGEQSSGSDNVSTIPGMRSW